MEIGLLVALGLGAALPLVVLAALSVLVVRSRRRTQRALDAAHRDLELLRARLEEIESSGAPTAATSVVPPAEFLITDAGAGEGAYPPVVPGRAVLSATLGEPLVKAVAFGYAVRRALSAESRNRIAFEMRREVRRSRKQRRRDLRGGARRQGPAVRADGLTEEGAA